MPALAFALKYWREIAVGLLILLLVGAGFYLRNVFAERDKLQQENQVLTVQLRDAAAMQEFSNKVTEAIGQIRIRSNVNVSKIESAPAPQFIDAGTPIPFIPAGVPGAQGLYSSATSPGTRPGAPGGAALPAAVPAGAVLPDRSRTP